MLRNIHEGYGVGSTTLPIDPGIIDLKRLQMFYIAVKAGTFSAAAQSLGVSPSAISHALKGLEEELGRSLFKRSGPHVSPTGTAIRLLPIVEDLLLRMASIRSELAKMDGRDEKLVFGVSASAWVVLTTSAMSAFCECFPNADVEIVQTMDRDGASNVLELDFEIGPSKSAPRDAVRRKLVEETLQLYAAPFHELGLSGKATTAQLRQNVLIFPDRMAAELVRIECFQGSERSLRSWIIPDARAARDLAMQGQCLAFLPEAVADGAVSSGDLKLLKSASMPLTRDFSAWWDARSPLTWIAEVFLSLLTVEHETAG